jgi:uncharacterized protein YllA (UPF0747 family)
VSDFNEDMNNQLKELKENSSKQMKDIKKTMQDKEEEISNDTEILIKNPSEMKS